MQVARLHGAVELDDAAAIVPPLERLEVEAAARPEILLLEGGGKGLALDDLVVGRVGLVDGEDLFGPGADAARRDGTALVGHVLYVSRCVCCAFAFPHSFKEVLARVRGVGS